MPKLGDVEYDDAGWEFMTQVCAQRELDGSLPGTLKHEAFIVHTIYEEFPGVTMSNAESTPAPAPARAHARSGDPWTSHAAARSLDAETLRKTQEAVLDCFKTYGAMHHERLVEIYEAAHDERGWPRQSVSGLRTRTRELVDLGRVRDARAKVQLPSRRWSIVWEAA